MKMEKYHDIKDVKFNNDEMRITIDGKEHTFQLGDVSLRLKNAKETDRENYQISSSGYGIHWPGIDEDLSIDGLLGVKHKSHFKERRIAS
jgi:hypothetical protein